MKQAIISPFKKGTEIPTRKNTSNPGKCDLCCKIVSERRVRRVREGRDLKLCSDCHRQVRGIKPQPERRLE